MMSRGSAIVRHLSSSSAARRAGTPRNSSSASLVKTTSSATSTSYVLSWPASMQVHGRLVAQREPVELVGAAQHDQDLGGLGRLAQRRDRGLGRRLLAGDERLDHVHPAVAGPVGEGATQGGGLHLLRGPLAVVARHGAVHDATAGELRRADRALTGATGALLLVRLLAAAGDLAAGLRLVRALAGGGELGHDDLVHQRDVRLHVEDVAGQLDRAGLRRPRR